MRSIHSEASVRQILEKMQGYDSGMRGRRGGGEGMSLTCGSLERNRKAPDV